ncbi:dTDP-4-dehydrorhamnose reductase [Seonamhaeicola maritimus]|uniref:dTDP-4-dehydrorhamnose reductase n=1 Tax=Seonamhaeicola maritimus TaxID=2591822 RepID=A0A5C7GI24_9FLAO|nr:dTDP-4-dehydrorhamnose reductase [Seonamhaeicola maritimus]TXG37163.1 dTDP-4-dehydrorhamnose reductase [Seonamhaeicola maritimus]
MPIKVLVTGADGQLGKTFQDLAPKYKELIDFYFVSKEELDISKTDNLKKDFNSNEFDYCINCAAYTNVEQAEKTPDIAYKINAESVKNLAQVCKNYNVILVHISTDYVFDGAKKSPYTIDDIPNPINEYGKSKLLGEQHIQMTLDKYFIVRTSWLYSKKYGKNFYRFVLNEVSKGNKLSITTDQKANPTDTVDLANFIIKLIQTNSSDYGLVHFSGSKSMTWYDFAKLIVIENKIENVELVEVDSFNTLAKRPKYSALG